ncbi:hypothetical protein K1X76_08045 [bacterium]|nr:hypothetical protein [bacterium]
MMVRLRQISFFFLLSILISFYVPTTHAQADEIDTEDDIQPLIDITRSDAGEDDGVPTACQGYSAAQKEAAFDVNPERFMKSLLSVKNLRQLANCNTISVEGLYCQEMILEPISHVVFEDGEENSVCVGGDGTTVRFRVVNAVECYPVTELPAELIEEKGAVAKAEISAECQASLLSSAEVGGEIGLGFSGGCSLVNQNFSSNNFLFFLFQGFFMGGVLIAFKKSGAPL